MGEQTGQRLLLQTGGISVRVCVLVYELCSLAFSVVHVMEEPRVSLPHRREGPPDGPGPLESPVGTAHQVQAAAIRTTEAVDTASNDLSALFLRTYSSLRVQDYNHVSILSGEMLRLRD